MWLKRCDWSFYKFIEEPITVMWLKRCDWSCYKFIEVNFSKLKDSNQIFRNEFVCIHASVKFQLKLLSVKFLPLNELSITIYLLNGVTTLYSHSFHISQHVCSSIFRYSFPHGHGRPDPGDALLSYVLFMWSGAAHTTSECGPASVNMHYHILLKTKRQYPPTVVPSYTCAHIFNYGMTAFN